MPSVDFAGLAKELLQAESHFAFEDSLAILGNENQMIAKAILRDNSIGVRPAPILMGVGILIW